MRTILALAGALALAGTAAAAQRKPPAPIPGWIPGLEAGFAEAERTGKPLLVVFR